MAIEPASPIAGTRTLPAKPRSRDDITLSTDDYCTDVNPLWTRIPVPGTLWTRSHFPCPQLCWDMAGRGADVIQQVYWKETATYSLENTALNLWGTADGGL